MPPPKDRDVIATLNPERTAVLSMDLQAGIVSIYAKDSPRSRNALFGAIKSSPQHQKLFEGETGDIHRSVAPHPTDIVVTKHRVSAFAGTDLEMILRARDVDTLVLFGIATSGVELSTLLHASDADFRIVVIRDCCADVDPDLHACLLNSLFPRS
jgi:nicotinamidase-related amidase